MGFSGLVAISTGQVSNPDLAFFQLLLNEKSLTIPIIIIFLAISLTISSIDTIINAISSLVIVDGKKIIRLKNYDLLSKLIIIILSVVTLFIASKGLSILYLFLLADLLCCAAVLSIFYGFYSKSFLEKNAYVSIIIGTVAGLLLFPSPDFSKSILIGILFPIELFPKFILESLLFMSFILATITPIITLNLKKK